MLKGSEESEVLNGISMRGKRGVVNKLSEEEHATLKLHESTIEKGLQVFFDVGAALQEIRANELYREEYESFEEYCEERWNFRRNYASRLIRAARIRQILKEEGGFEVLPETESQARPLSRLSKDRLIQGWGVLLKQNDNQVPNGAEIRKFVDQYKVQSSKKGEKAEKPKNDQKEENESSNDPNTLLLEVERKLKKIEKSEANEDGLLEEVRKEISRVRRILKRQ